MGVYSHIQKLWRKPKENLGSLWRERLIQWRREPVTLRLEHPTRLDRARSLGWKAKQGFLIIRQRVSRGSHRKPDWSGARMSRNMKARKDLRKNYQLIAEERAGRNYRNCEVLNSYYVAHDGKFQWFEVILLDKTHPVVQSDKRVSWVVDPVHRGRAHRGLTSSGRKIRGLRWKGKGAEKARPSRRSRDRLL